MPRSRLSPRAAAGRVRRAAATRREVRVAIRRARAFRRTHPAPIRVCWDLDNTLVDSGPLLRDGHALTQAIVDAYPVANMPAFYDALHAALPGAAHFILSARPSSTHAHTVDWLARHRVAATADVPCLIPDPHAKPRIWDELARDAQLVIVDDLSFNHEHEELSLYEELAEIAVATASVYVGLDDIGLIADDPDAVGKVVSRITRELGTRAGRG